MVRRVKTKSIHSYLYLFRFDGFTFFVYVSGGRVSKGPEIEELIKEMKEYRDGMVVRNLPFQWISDIITKWEMKKFEKDTCTCGRSPTGDCIGWHKLTEENYKKSLTHYNKHTPAIDGVGE